MAAEKPTNQLSIFERIDLAAAEIAKTKFTKTKQVWVRRPNFKSDTGEFYTILTIGDILDAVRPAHAKYGIKLFIDPPQYDHDQHESVKLDNGEYHARGRCSYRLIGRDLDDMIEGQVPVEAMDRRDKLNNKLITNAERTIYRVLYAIDGDDARDPEEINAGTDTEPAARRPIEEAAKSDPFFSKKEAAPNPEAITVPNPEPSDVTTDRPRETMLATILNAYKDALLRPIVKKATTEADCAAINTDEWTDDQVKAVYKAVVKAGRAAE